MKSGFKITGDQRLIAKFKAHPEQINRVMESVLKQEARGLCVEYARRSGPGKGLTDTPIIKAQDAVETDVRRVFATADSPWRVFDLLKKHAPKYATAYWNAYKSKKPRSMAAILRKSGVPTGMSASQQRAARTGAGGRVPKTHVHDSLANSASVRVLIRQLQARVGMAKAGWLCAAKALGGRVRTRYQRGGAIVNVEKFPPSVRRVASKFPGLGGARFLSSGGKVEVEVFTSAGHAKKALSNTDYQSANAAAKVKLGIALAESVRALNREKFK